MMKSVPRVLHRCPPHDKIMPQLSCKENHRFMAQTKHKGGLADKLILFTLQLAFSSILQLGIPAGIQGAIFSACCSAWCLPRFSVRYS